MFRTRTVRLAQRRSQAARASYAPARLGLPTRAEVVERYAQRTGLADVDASWYEGFACFKTAVILQQLYVRFLRGETSDERMGQRGARVAPAARRASMILEGRAGESS